MIPNLTILTLDKPSINDFAAARNELLKSCQTDWALFLDSDETLSKNLEKEIAKAIQTPAFVAYNLSRQDTFIGKTLLHGENAANLFTRLVRVGEGRWERPVHEVWVTKGPVGRLNSPLEHQLPTISALLAKINHYSTLEASYRHSQGTKSSMFKLSVYPFGKFLYNYLLRLGILDGIPGTIMAGLMAFHSYLTWTKLYLLWHKK